LSLVLSCQTTIICFMEMGFDKSRCLSCSNLWLIIFFFLSSFRPFLFLCFFKSLSQIFINRVLPARLDRETRMLKLFPSSGRCLQRLLCNYGSDNPWNPLKKGYYLCTDFPPPSLDKPLMVDVLPVIVCHHTLHGPWVHYDVLVVIILVKMKMVSHRPHV
jgi:hypothetical protein